MVLKGQGCAGNDRGFALIISLAAMAFIILLLVVLSTVVRVEMSHFQGMILQESARQNAILGMSVAMGELQQTSGPDQRSTGRADLVSREVVSVSAAESGTDVSANVTAYWGSARNRNWTGVWSNSNETVLDPTAPADYQAIPELENWLVSGNEDTVSFEPFDPINGLNENSTFGTELSDASGNRFALMVRPRGSNATTALANAVSAPIVDLADEIPGWGGYAWWVGDEGVKARGNLLDEYAGSSVPDEVAAQVASAARLAIEGMSTNGADGLASFFPVGAERLSEIRLVDELRLLETDPDFSVELYWRFHDISMQSRGVLSDAENGGLKRDLSYILGQPDVASLRQALGAAYDIPMVGGDQVIDPIADYNYVLNRATTPYAYVPEDDTGQKYSFSDDPIFSASPTWEMLWSFHNMGNLVSDLPAGSYNASGEAVPRLISPTAHGLSPLVIQAKIYYGLRFSGTIGLEMRPLVVLANPYSVPLAPADYHVVFFEPNGFLLKFGTYAKSGPAASGDPYPDMDDREVDLETLYGSGNVYGGFGRSEIILRSEGMDPGEAQIFTLEDSGRVIPAGSAAQEGFEVVLVNDFDPDAYILFDTGEAAPAGNGDPLALEDEGVALLMDKQAMSLKMYLGYSLFQSGSNDRFMLQHVDAWYDRSESDYLSSGIYVVHPTNSSEGTLSRGGGAEIVHFDSQSGHRQRGIFLDQNYRKNVTSGHLGYTSSAHLMERFSLRIKNGSYGNDAYFQGNILRPDSGAEAFQNAKWGIINMGTGSKNTVPPGGENTGFHNLLYEIAGQGNGPTSIGDLAHLNVSAFIDRDSWSSKPYVRQAIMQSWQPNYTVANSYAHPLVRRHRIFDNIYSGYSYDGSYLWNDVLWDRFYFSTYPVRGDFDFSTDSLVNSRYKPFRSESEVAWDDETRFRGDGNASESANSRIAAANLMVDGAFNVNSTSVDAWRSLLSSLKGVRVGGGDEANAPFLRTLSVLGDSEEASTGNHPNAWQGYRDLSWSEVDEIALEMVKQIELRGPFLSLADFVNRQLVEAGDDGNDLALKGALQSALDAVVNNGMSGPGDVDIDYNINYFADPEYVQESLLSGFPGYLLQSDILASIGQYLAVRSDTFRIRSYGEADLLSNRGGKTRVWIEAIVQRVPDYVEPEANTAEDSIGELVTANDEFGRAFRVVSMRWLRPEEI